MSMPDASGLVSVLIPTFNRAYECKRAIQSVLAQTYNEFEIVVIDDGSTDNTQEIVGKLDSRVKYVWQENAGVSAARNRGMEISTGDYIAFLDSDDLWLPWKLDLQLASLTYFPEAGMVWTNMIAIDSNGAEISKNYLSEMYKAYRYFDHNRDFERAESIGAIWQQCPQLMSERLCYMGSIFPWLFMGNLVHTSTVLLRRSRQTRVGNFRTDLKKTGEDYDFHLRTCEVGPVVYLDVSSIYYRVGAQDQLTSEKLMIWMAQNNLTTVNYAYENYRKKITLPDVMIRERLAASHLWVGINEVLDGQGSSARGHLLQGIKDVNSRKKAVVFYLLSFFPMGILKFLRRMRHRL